jgi:hypothetical protein
MGIIWATAMALATLFAMTKWWIKLNTPAPSIKFLDELNQDFLIFALFSGPFVMIMIPLGIISLVMYWITYLIDRFGWQYK